MRRTKENNLNIRRAWEAHELVSNMVMRRQMIVLDDFDQILQVGPRFRSINGLSWAVVTIWLTALGILQPSVLGNRNNRGTLCRIGIQHGEQ